MNRSSNSETPARKPLIRQGWLRVLLFCISGLFLAMLIMVPLLLILWKSGQGSSGNTSLPAFLQGLRENNLGMLVLVETIIVVLNVWIFRRWFDRKSLASLGLSPEGFGTEALTGLLMGPALLGIAAIVLLLTGHLSWVDFNFDPSSLFLSLGLLLLVAFSEELIFRGYILNNLMESIPNRWIALAITSVLFAIMHLSNPGMNTLAFINLILAGMLLGLNYIYTGNLWFAFTFHVSWNFFQGPVLGFPVSGEHLSSFLILETRGDQAITGGDFGLEGSIVTTLLSFATLLILALVYEKKYVGGSMKTI